MKVRKRKEATHSSGPIAQNVGTSTKMALIWLCYRGTKMRVEEEMRGESSLKSGWVIFKTEQPKQATQGERQWKKACQNAGQSNKACCTKLIYCRVEPSAFYTHIPLAPEGVLPCKILQNLLGQAARNPINWTCPFSIINVFMSQNSSNSVS